MKICVVASKFGTESEIGRHLGTYRYFIELTRRLKSLGHEVVVVAPWLSFAIRGSTNVDGVKVWRYYPPLWNSRKWFFLSRPLRWWYMRATAKVVMRLDRVVAWDGILVWQARETGFAVAKIAETLRAPLLFRQITAWQWHLSRPLSSMFGQRKWYRKSLDPILEWLLDRKRERAYAQKIYESAAKVLFVSRAAAAAEASPFLSPEKIVVWPVAVETDLFAPHGDKLQWRKKLNIRGEQVLLFIGRINFEEKGIGYLLEAMPQIISRFPQANLVIVGGGGETARLERMIETLNIQANVQCVGRQPFERLADYLQAADVLVVPSTWVEHFGQVTIEAMAAGVPVVTTDLGGSPEINLDGQTGLVVPAADSRALADAIGKLLSDPDLRDSMGRAARQRVLANYTYEVLIDKFLKIVEDVRAK